MTAEQFMAVADKIVRPIVDRTVDAVCDLFRDTDLPLGFLSSAFVSIGSNLILRGLALLPRKDRERAFDSIRDTVLNAAREHAGEIGIVQQSAGTSEDSIVDEIVINPGERSDGHGR